ncbi:hypothetical protein DAPPUDRAFT_251928 [Daphnia pulex]|uniref:MYND-type domain-containing protein n=1 Tax=Daphnia pulex TaxID=6669 RepID=E9H181_DAPPU|nr:hypothetical protein DAPPUDRAFT_251928 [Daphnia pulex]|eukprot:EFX74461.1 hypothetical protein DAPPUDRAFT_251928 [Daphnia pulex]
MHEERNNAMLNGWIRLNHKINDEQDNPTIPEAAIEGFTRNLASKFEDDVQNSTKVLIEKEARLYFSTGTCKLQSELRNVCVNPTLLDPTTYRWQVHYQLCPFDGYFPLTREELDTSDNKGILIRTCQKILRGFVAEYKKRSDKVKIFFHLEDALEFCLSESTISFDVIDCSNLADHVGLVNLINACEKKLMDTPEAVLYTESMLWPSLAPSLLKYIEEALCCPLSMIPTIYGLRLATHVEFGSNKPLNLGQQMANAFKLCWKKVLPFGNVSLSPSPTLTHCLDQLTQKCFTSTGFRQVEGKKTGERCGMTCYSPLTFNYVLDSMAQRVGGELNNLPKLSEMNIHVIDNCEIKIKKTRDCEMETISVSFLLVPGHGLEKTHAACVFDAHTGLPISQREEISAMRVEPFHEPYPWRSKGSALPLANSNGLQVNNCVESEDFFILQIVVECSSENISGLNVSTNQRLPCESAHDVIISLNQPNDIKPLKLSFPYPIVVNEIRATLRRKDRLINLVLKKALYEPWPYEFHTQHSRWIVLDRLKLWEDKNTVDSLGLHLGTQFKLSDFKNMTLTNKSALNEVRHTIQSLFLSATVHGRNEYFGIGRKDSSQSPDWYIRAHLPLRISPVGSPLLILSAVDHRLAENLIEQGRLNKDDAFNDYVRIYAQPSNETKNMILTFTPEEEQLLRYILRLNSTKIVPTTWQKKNLPLGENSPWLATFISPLYDDHPMDQASLEACQKTEGINPKGKSCASCKKISENLKRCSRCRTVVYCSVECQRGHWTLHKTVCINTCQK